MASWQFFPWLPTILFVGVLYDARRLLLIPIIYHEHLSSPSWVKTTSLVCPSIMNAFDLDID